jgi:hypothetical protein
MASKSMNNAAAKALAKDAELDARLRRQQRDRKEALIRALAEYLVEDEFHKSILLQMGKPEARTWAKLRGLTSIRGNGVTVEEAIKILSEDLA